MTPNNPTSELKPTLDALFQFKIGDLVQTRVKLAHIKSELTLNAEAEVSAFEFERQRFAAPMPLIVSGRLVEECHGGIQMFYFLGGLNSTPGGGPATVRFSELELVPHDDAVAAVAEIANVVRANIKKATADSLQREIKRIEARTKRREDKAAEDKTE